MGRAALKPDRRGAATVERPRFDRLDGPLIAVCGLAGGAGTSTLALALARYAAARASVPVLLTETAPERAGLALLTGRASPLCLRELARELAAGEQPAEAFVELEHGLRLVAAAPRAAAAPKPDQLTQLLRQARAAHGLVVVDCGQPSSDHACALDSATQIVWTVPASRDAVRRAEVLFAADVFPRPGRAPEVLVASALQPGGRVGVRELRRLAEQRCDRLALVPHSDRLASDGPAGLADLDDAVGLVAGLIPEAA